MRFVDLFAGLGGFHVALTGLGHKCVFASELDPELRATYQENFGLKPAGDIRDVLPTSIPDHEVLCAGFPCQPFSKAGTQLGDKCPKNGDLFSDYVAEILRVKKPRYLLLENVPNLLRHKNGRTWKKMEQALQILGYDVQAATYSPHEFGVPQKRERVFVVGVLGESSLDKFKWPEKRPVESSVVSVLENKPRESKALNKRQIEIIDLWQEFLDRIPETEKLPSFPIWAMEFDATYPSTGPSPSQLTARQLARYKGPFGQKLSELPPDDRLGSLPSYAQRGEECFPKWKTDFINSNRDFFKHHRKQLLPWIKKVRVFEPSYQKFEWNCQGEPRNLSNYILQFRASGIRVKRPDLAPSLVAMTLSQVPIIGWEKRYMTKRECARLQSLHGLKRLPSSDSAAFKALGNAVNASVVKRIADALIKHGNNVAKKKNKAA